MGADREGAKMVDPHGRAIDYLRLSITDLCNLRCFYCMPDGVPNKLTHDEVLRQEEQLEVVSAAVRLGVKKVRITGGEPLIKKGVFSLISRISSLDGVRTVAMTTNGVLLAQHAKRLKEAGLSSINVSLDALHPDLYERITKRGNLEDVLRGLRVARELGFAIKLNTVLLKDVNTHALHEFVKLAKESGFSLRFIERMGFDKEEPLFSQDEAVEQLSRRYSVERREIDPAHPHVARFVVDGLEVGFISPLTHSFCAGCNKLRLQPDGLLRSCLADPRGVDVRAILRVEHTARDVEEAVLEAVKKKPAAAPWTSPAQMWKVGG